MGENEKFNLWYAGQPINDVGVATTMIYAPDDRGVRVWDGSQISSAVGYANVGTADVRPHFQYISDKTAKEFESACNSYLDTLSEVSKSLNPCLERLIAHFGKPTKRNKHYKPKFTL